MGSWSHSTWSATQVEKWKTTTTANESAKKQANDQRTRDRDGRTSCKRPLEACQTRGQGQVGVPSICCSQGTARGIPPSRGPLSTFTASTRPTLQDEQDQRRDRTSRARSLPGKDRLDKHVWSSTFEQPGSSLPGCKGGGQVMVASWNATRNKLCSLHIHMCHKDCVEGVETTRNPNGRLPGRLHHSDASHDIPRSTTTAHNGDQNIHQARLQDQHTKKSAEPTKVVTFLGTEINTTTWEIKWPMAKRRAVQKSIQKLLNGAQTARSLARVMGALKAAGPAWPTVHLETFLLQKEVSQMARQGWDTKMSLSDQTYRELRRIHRLLNHEIITPITRGRVQATLTTDAAPSHGWGATLQIGDKVWKYSEQWTENQRGRHSTEMEMKAVACAMMHFQPLIRDTKLLVQSDCTAVVWDLTRKRVRSERLRATVMLILDMTVKMNISLTSSHLAGVLNVVSDKLSRTEAHSGLVLRAEVFARIQDQLGPCTIDAFATQTNTKLPRYISWQPDPEAEAQDFFAQHLNKKELYYIFPPIALLLQALAKVRNEQARAVIVAPCFPDQVWAPLLRSGTLKSINLGTDALVPNRASSELPRNTQWKACLWGMQEH